MCRKAPRLIALLFSLFVAVPALAADWQVVRTVGTVWVIAVDAQRMPAEAGMTLPPNATVATLKGARAMLRNGEDILNVGPNTQLAPQARRVRGLTTVLMRQGRLDLDIVPLGRPHFAVQTPILAAVVKGTRFSVTVSDDQARVAVSRGRVAVTALAAGQSVDVTPGQAVRVTNAGLTLSGGGVPQLIHSVTPQAPLVQSLSALDSASASGQETAAAAASGDVGIGTTVSGVASSASSVGSAVSDVASSVGDTVSDVASSSAASSSNAASGLANAVSHASSNAAKGLSNAIEHATSK